MKKLIHILIALFLMAGVWGCWFDATGYSESYGGDKEDMQALMKELDSVGFKYSVNKEGGIRFSTEDGQEFEKIRKKVSKKRSRRLIVEPENPASRERYVNLLEKESIEYTILNKEDSIKVELYPKNEKHSQELRNQFLVHTWTEKKKEREDRQKNRRPK